MDPTQENSREFLEQAIDTKVISLEEYIQAEIRSVEESVRVLKLRRNALQPISSIPPEIFVAIFSYLCLPGIPSLGGKPSRNCARLRISHVCHQWREIALNQPRLWSHVNFNAVSLAAAAEILNRAKSVPLYIETGVSGRYDDDRFVLFLKEVQARLPHTRHLSISTESFGTMYRGLKHVLVSPAPTLEYLSLFCEEDDNQRMADRQLSISHTLFGGSTPRLSCLKLHNCNISWNSPLFKGLTHLEILTPYKMARPSLAVWLDTLDEVPQLKTLTLHSASPAAVHLPFDVERTVTLPSLTHLDISASLPDCALVSAYLDLPALTSLCLTGMDPPTNGSVQDYLAYVVRHVHGPQDIRPLQSVLIRDHWDELDLLAWPVPDIDTFVHDPPAFLGATLPTRVKLSFRNIVTHLELFETMMAALPLDGLLTLAAVDLKSSLSVDLKIQQFWLRLLPNWPLLQRVRLAPIVLRGFIMALLEDCKVPLLPSMTELALAETTLDAGQTRFLCDALLKRVEQGVPLETLDLRMCRRDPYNIVAVQSLSEIAIDILRPLDFLGPEDTDESRDAGFFMFATMLTMWEPFLPYPCYSSEDDSEYEESDDEDDEDDDWDENDEEVDITTEVENFFTQWMEEDMLDL